MAKKNLTIEEKIARLEGIKTLLNYLDEQISYKANWANDYLEQSKDETGEVDEESYNYERYTKTLVEKEALEILREEIEELAD